MKLERPRKVGFVPESSGQNNNPPIPVEGDREQWSDCSVPANSFLSASPDVLGPIQVLYTAKDGCLSLKHLLEDEQIVGKVDTNQKD